MKKSNFLIATALLVSPLAMAASSQDGTGETDGYKLVWQDLFDANELNSQRWNIEVNGDGGGNNELQYYTDRAENVRLGDDGKGNGCLILTAKKEVYGGRQATSGRITSKNKIAFKHGKIEAAIKLPKTANGLWPAFWMMGNDYDQVGWPRCGETDIMEFGNATGIKNGTQDRYFNGACHWGQSWENHPNYARAVTYQYSLQDDEFHIYTLIWDEEKVAMYVDLDKYPDAEPYYIMTIPATNDTNSPGYYFHKENFILFNLAVGGNFPGIWDINQITALNESNDYQASMYVNYVKIYQKGTADESSSFLDKGDMGDAGVETVAAGLDMNYNGKMLNFSDKADVVVYDIAGKMVASHKAVDAVSVAGFVPGIYVVKAVCNGKQLVEKIVCK
jgi:beta-glucanase (GH16 family)